MPELDFSEPQWIRDQRKAPTQPMSLAEAFQLQQRQQQIDSEKALLPLKQQELQAQIANAALDHKILQEKMDMQLKSKAADAAVWGQIANISDTSDLTQWKPVFEQFAKTPWVSKDTMSFVDMSVKAGQLGKDKMDQLNAKIDADLAKPQKETTLEDTIQNQLKDEITSRKSQGLPEMTVGEIADFKKNLRAQSSTLGGGKESTDIFDAQGNLLFRSTKGGGMPQGTTPGLQTKAQEDMLNNKKNFDVLSGLSGIDPGSVGIKGVIGNMLFDRLLSQVDPTLASDKRIDDRTKLISIQKKLAQSIVYSPRATKEDKAEANAALPSPGMAESVPDIQQKARSLGNILKRWTYDDAKAQGVPPPYWSMQNPDEIKAMFNKKKSELEKAVAEGKITSAKAKAEILHERADATEVLESQYNFNVQPTQ